MNEHQSAVDQANEYIRQLCIDETDALLIEVTWASTAASVCGCPTCKHMLEVATTAYWNEVNRQDLPQPDHEEDYVAQYPSSKIKKKR